MVLAVPDLAFLGCPARLFLDDGCAVPAQQTQRSPA